MTQPLPAIFFGHGSPMNAVTQNRYTDAWRTFGASIPKPRAIVMVSAHWYGGAAVTSSVHAPLIYDFFGFPAELSQVKYPAPGAPEIAAEVARIARPANVALNPARGLDHGAWSVLVHAFPDADIPVLQFAIDAGLSFDQHLELGARLAPLREQGILLAASGNVVHNLRRIDWSQPEAAFDWSRRFDEHVKDLMTHDPASVAGVESHPDYALAAPTPEHFIPLLYTAGVAKAAGKPAEVLVDGYAMGSLSMTAYTVAA